MSISATLLAGTDSRLQAGQIGPKLEPPARAGCAAHLITTISISTLFKYCTILLLLLFLPVLPVLF